MSFCNLIKYGTGVSPGIFLEPKMNDELNLEAEINDRIPLPCIPRNIQWQFTIQVELSWSAVFGTLLTVPTGLHRSIFPTHPSSCHLLRFHYSTCLTYLLSLSWTLSRNELTPTPCPLCPVLFEHFVSDPYPMFPSNVFPAGMAIKPFSTFNCCMWETIVVNQISNNKQVFNWRSIKQWFIWEATNPRSQKYMVLPSPSFRTYRDMI